MTIDEIRQNEIDYCLTHPLYFVDRYGHIEDKEAEQLIQPFEMWKEQKETFEAFFEYKRTIILKARQLGFTWLVLHYAALMLLRPGRTVIAMSKTEDDAKELIRRLSVIYTYMPELIREKTAGYTGIWFEPHSLVLHVHHPGQPDSKMQCFAAAADSARSFTADLLIIDEWASQQFAREIWASAYPTINSPKGGQVIGLSTNKRGSLFEELYLGENSFHKVFIGWRANPSRSQEWYDNTLKDIGKAAMWQEYPETEEQALEVPGGAFFPEVTADSIISTELLKQSLRTYFVLDYGLDKFAGYWIQRDAFGNAQVVHEEYESNMIIGAVCERIRKVNEREGYTPVQYLGPPDLWNREQVTGKSRAILFSEHGINLTKVNNDIAAGCSAMKEYLVHDEDAKSKLTIFGNSAPNLYNSLRKIQTDEKKPSIYANQPHELTHAVDALRYFCVYWTLGATNPTNSKQRKWTEDMYEDYRNANLRDREYLISIWGEPN